MRDSRNQLLQRGLTLSSASSANIVGSLSKQFNSNTSQNLLNSSSFNSSEINFSQIRGKRKSKTANSESNNQKNDYQIVEDVCKSKHIVIEPKIALNDRSEWKYIVNLGERNVRLRQTIRVELCS